MMSCRRRQRFFSESGNGYQINKKIRDMVILQPQFVCRSAIQPSGLAELPQLLIYLAPDVHAALLGHFHYSMNSDSYLLLGSSESIGGQPVCLPCWAAAASFIAARRTKTGKRLIFNRNTRRFTNYPRSSDDPPHEAHVERRPESPSERFLLHTCTRQPSRPTMMATSCISSGKPDRYPKLAEGRAHLNIMNMVS